tara:strand:+ start:793 stop:960 length:168 start_codon:yes stop_codon:yes gene_type:complete
MLQDYDQLRSRAVVEGGKVNVVFFILVFVALAYFGIHTIDACVLDHAILNWINAH